MRVALFATSVILVATTLFGNAWAQGPKPIGYVPPPAIGPNASTEQPPVVDLAETAGRAADRCRESPESAMAPVVITVELALCALSTPWRSGATAASPSVVPPPAGPTEPDPAMR